MFKNIVTLTILGLIAWYLETVLEVILPIPTKEMFDGFLNLNIDWHYSLFKFLRYFVWILALWIVFKYIRPVFGFLLPMSKQFSTTKPVRRLHSIMTELMIFGTALIIISIFFIINPTRQTYKYAFKEAKQNIEFGIDNDYSNSNYKIRSFITSNREAAINYIRNSSNDYQIKSEIWPLDNSKTIEQYSASKEFPAWKRLKNWAFGNEKQDIRLTAGYQEYFKNQKQAFQQLQFAKTTKIDSKARLDELAKAAVRKELGNPIMHALSSFNGKLCWLLICAFASYLLVHLFIRTGLGKGYENLLAFFNQARFGKGGSARFAGLFEEWTLRFKNQKYGLFMGKSLYNPFRNIGLEDLRHMLTIAMTRSGKGIAVIITNLLLWRGSTILVDVKGANAIVTARRRREMGQDVHIIDPFSITGEDSASINILSMFDPSSLTIREELLSLAEALVIRDEKEESHWVDGAKTVIAGLLAHLITSLKYKNPNLMMLRDMISMLPEKQAELWAEMSLNDGAGKLARDAAIRIIRGIATDEISNILSNVDKHTEWLNSEAIASVLKKTSFNFSDLKEKPTTIYLVLPPNQLVTHSRFLRLFINLTLSQISNGGKSKVPILMILDEFLALGKMTEVEKAFPLMAGFNLIMWPFLQSLEGLKKLYGTNGADTFLSNSRAIQVFGVDGGATKEFVSQHIGQIALKEQRGKTVPLRTPSEVAIDVAAESGRQYILRAGKPPLILEKVPYYMSAPIKMLRFLPFFKGIFHKKYDSDPDYV